MKIATFPVRLEEHDTPEEHRAEIRRRLLVDGECIHIRCADGFTRFINGQDFSIATRNIPAKTYRCILRMRRDQFWGLLAMRLNLPPDVHFIGIKADPGIYYETYETILGGHGLGEPFAVCDGAAIRRAEFTVENHRIVIHSE